MDNGEPRRRTTLARRIGVVVVIDHGAVAFDGGLDGLRSRDPGADMETAVAGLYR
ncbi:hypothetical protein [Nocardiopsis salina]|uniref:hypothetical protein n=1 Tax=Nocardiopsis salina TaxID=245836 RepID=UPI000344F8D7|nr:hypothetical protein [Nocardiopsis salina]